MIIDGHAHSAGEFYDAAGAVRVLDALGVDKVVLAPGPVNEPIGWRVPDTTRILNGRRMSFVAGRLLHAVLKRLPERYSLKNGNAHVARMAAERPDRIVQSWWIDPGDPGAVEELPARHREHRFGVLKVHQALRPLPTDAPEMHALAEFAGERGLPFFIHPYEDESLVQLLRLARAHPATSFISAHCLGLTALIRGGGMALPNLYLDVSPPNMVPWGRLRLALRRFGPAKLVMGSDAPYGKENTRAAIERVNRFRISEDARRLILGDTMARLLGVAAGGRAGANDAG